MKLAQLGRYCFALALLAFGVQHFVYAKYSAGIGPPWIPGHTLRACLMGTVLVLASLAIITGRKAHCAAITLACVFFIYFLLAYAPRIVAHLHDPGPWTSGAEIVAFCGVSCALAASFAKRPASRAWMSHSLFALTLIVFGVQHLIYGPFVATLVPALIPGHLFFAYGIGVAFLATALSLLSNIQARLAAILLGIMFFSWVFILHLPRVLAASTNGNEWTSMFVALAMSGGAWIVAGDTQA